MLPENWHFSAACAGRQQPFLRLSFSNIFRSPPGLSPLSTDDHTSGERSALPLQHTVSLLLAFGHHFLQPGFCFSMNCLRAQSLHGTLRRPFLSLFPSLIMERYLKIWKLCVYLSNFPTKMVNSEEAGAPGTSSPLNQHARHSTCI